MQTHAAQHGDFGPDPDRRRYWSDRFSFLIVIAARKARLEWTRRRMGAIRPPDAVYQSLRRLCAIEFGHQNAPNGEA